MSITRRAPEPDKMLVSGARRADYEWCLVVIMKVYLDVWRGGYHDVAAKRIARHGSKSFERQI